MTTMIPEECFDTNPVAKTLYQNLYNQLGPDYKIIQHLKSPKDNAGTDLGGSLFWIQFKQQSVFLYLSDAPPGFFDKTNPKDQKSIKNRLLNHPEFLALTRFQTNLIPSPLHAHKANLVPFLMIFSNIDGEKLNLGIRSLGIYLLGKEKLASNNLRKLVVKYLSEPLSPATHHHIRCVFNPELAVYSHQVDNCLLDNEQEVALKNDVLLTNAKTRDEHLNLRGVNGSINSGKSEVVIQRAKLIKQSTANDSDTNDKKVLILTPDNVSQVSLNKRYYTLHPTDKKTDILSLNQWCEQLIKPTTKISDIENTAKIINGLMSEKLDEQGIGRSIFIQELEFILGRMIFSEKDYLTARRPIQSYSLSEKKHRHIWKASQTFLKELKSNNTMLDIELPQQLWKLLQDNSVSQTYDHILLDDAHLFPPIAFDLIKQLIKPKTGQLFITQNPNQLLLNSCMLWQDTGLELRGHSTRLLNNYQINPYILNAASSFYLHRLPSHLDRTIHRNLPDITENPMPTLLHFHSAKDEENRLLNKIRQTVNDGVTLEDILLISINSHAISKYRDMINTTLDIPTQKLMGAEVERKGLGVCSLLHAHGQSAPHVFIVGLHHIYQTEKNFGIGTHEHRTLLVENTKKLTMAMTCAKKELTLFITSETIPRDFISPHFDVPSINSDSYADVLPLRA
jgi:hypothetical protein